MKTESYSHHIPNIPRIGWRENLQETPTFDGKNM